MPAAPPHRPLGATVDPSARTRLTAPIDARTKRQRSPSPHRPTENPKQAKVAASTSRAPPARPVERLSEDVLVCVTALKGTFLPNQSLASVLLHKAGVPLDQCRSGGRCIVEYVAVGNNGARTITNRVVFRDPSVKEEFMGTVSLIGEEPFADCGIAVTNWTWDHKASGPRPLPGLARGQDQARADSRQALNEGLRGASALQAEAGNLPPEAAAAIKAIFKLFPGGAPKESLKIYGCEAFAES